MNEITVLVRYFAGAAAAAGTEEEKLLLPVGTPLSDVVQRLGARGPDLAKVLAASSYLLDAVSARPGDVLGDGVTLDVLPPFAGG